MAERGRLEFPCHNCGEKVKFKLTTETEAERLGRKTAFGTKTKNCGEDRHRKKGCGAPVTAVITLYHDYPGPEEKKD